MELSGLRRLAPSGGVVGGVVLVGWLCAVTCAVGLRAEDLRRAGGPGPVQKPSAYGEATRDESVDGFLRRFERASVGNDATVKADLYAEQMDRYFLKTHVTREFVYRDLLDWLSRGRLITSFRLTVLSDAGTGGGERTLVVRKEASWMDGGAMRVLVTRSQFILRRFGGEWKIVSERDYKPDR